MKKCKSNMSESFKRKSALHYALGGEVTQPPSKPAEQGILAKPLSQHVRSLDDPESATLATLPAPVAPVAKPMVPNLTNQELAGLGKNPMGTAPPTIWGAFKDRYGMGPSGYAHGGMVYSIPGEPGTATFPMHGAAGPSEMDLGAAGVSGMDNPLRRGYQTGGVIPPRPQPTVAPPSITAMPPAPALPPNVRVTPGFDPMKGGYHYEGIDAPLRGGKLPPPPMPFKYNNPTPDKPIGGTVRGSKGGPITDPGKDFPAEQGEDKHHIVVASGEYVLPNKTVDALGGAAALDKIVEATNGAPPNKLTGTNALRQYELGGPGPIEWTNPKNMANPNWTTAPGAAAPAAEAPATAAQRVAAGAKAAGQKVVGAANAVKGVPGALARGAMGVAGTLATTGSLGYAGVKGAGETTEEQAQRVGIDPNSGASRTVGQRVDNALRANPYVAPLYNAVSPPDRAHADEYALPRDLAIRGTGFVDNMTGGALGGVQKAWERAGGGAPQPPGAGNTVASSGGVSPEETRRGDVRTAPPADWSKTGERNPNPLLSSRVGNEVIITDGSTPEQMRNAEDFMHARAAERSRLERYLDARDRATNPRYNPANIAAEHAAIESKYAAPAQMPGTIRTSDGRDVPVQSIEGKLIAGAQNRRMMAESPLRTAEISASTQRRGQDLVYDAAVQHRALERQLAMQRARIEQFNKDRDYFAGRSDRAFEQDEKRTEAYNKILDNTFIRKGPKGEELGREERVRANELIMGTLQQAGVDPRTVSPQDFTEMARLAALDMATEKNREDFTGQLKTWITGPYAKATGLGARRGPVQIAPGALYDTVTLPDGRVITRREYEQGNPNLIINPPAHQRELDVLSNAYGRLRDR